MGVPRKNLFRGFASKPLLLRDGVWGAEPTSRVHGAAAGVGEAGCTQAPQPTSGYEPRSLLQERGGVSRCEGSFAAELPAGTVWEACRGGKADGASD